MKYKLLDNLGMNDALKCHIPGKHAKGDIVELSDAAAEFLKRKYPALLEAEAIRAVPPRTEVQAVPPQGSVERATSDLEDYRKRSGAKAKE